MVIVDGFLNVLRLQNHIPSVNTLILEGAQRGKKKGLISKKIVRLAPLNGLGGAERDRTVDLMTASKFPPSFLTSSSWVNFLNLLNFTLADLRQS